MLRRIAFFTALGFFLVLLSACNLPTSGTIRLPSFSLRSSATPPLSAGLAASPVISAAVAASERLTVTDPLAAPSATQTSERPTPLVKETVNLVGADTPTLARAGTGDWPAATSVVATLEAVTPRPAGATSVTSTDETVQAAVTSSFFGSKAAAQLPAETAPPVATEVVPIQTPTLLLLEESLPTSTPVRLNVAATPAVPTEPPPSPTAVVVVVSPLPVTPTEPPPSPTALVIVASPTPAEPAEPPSPPPPLIVVVSPEPAPTQATPAVPTKVPPAGMAELIWVQDSPRAGQDKLMAWSMGTTRQLASNNKQPARGWIDGFSASPDGAWVAYTTANSPLIWMVNAQTGEERQIKPKEPGGLYTRPAWSPDGSRLSFMIFDKPAPWVAPFQSGVWTSAPDGQDLRQVVQGLGWSSRDMALYGWSPTGQNLIYGVTGLTGSAFQWLAIPPGNDNPRYLPLAGTLYDIAPDGSWLLGDGFTPEAPVGRKDYSYNVLMSIPVDGKAPKVLTPRCQSDIAGRISPDGTRIAFLSLPSVSPACPRVSGALQYGLWVMNADGSGRMLVDGKSVIGREGPQWSRDGQSLYYTVWDKRTPSIWKAAAAGASVPAQVPGTEGAERFQVVR